MVNDIEESIKKMSKEEKKTFRKEFARQRKEMMKDPVNWRPECFQVENITKICYLCRYRLECSVMTDQEGKRILDGDHSV
jgi:hypothetical protein